MKRFEEKEARQFQLRIFISLDTTLSDPSVPFQILLMGVQDKYLNDAGFLEEMQLKVVLIVKKQENK